MCAVIRLLHLADLHLDWEPPWPAKSRDRKRERDSRLERAVSFALDTRIDLVVIAGDLFERHRPRPELVAQVKEELNRLVRAGVAVVTVPGNHDEISYHDSVYRVEASSWPGVLVQNPNFERSAVIETAGGRVHLYSLAYTAGLTFTERPLDRFPLEAEGGYHLAVLHGSLDWDRGDRSLPIDKDALAAAGFDYVALGHIHQHQVHPGRRGPIVYSGMIDGKGFDDPGTGLYTVVTLSTEGARLENVDAGGRPVRVLPVDAGAYPGWDELLHSVTSDVVEGEIVRVRLSGAPEYDLARERLLEAVSTIAFYAEVIDESERLSPALIEAIASEPTIRGAFVARIRERLASADDDEQAALRRALVIGLEALGGDGP